MLKRPELSLFTAFKLSELLVLSFYFLILNDGFVSGNHHLEPEVNFRNVPCRYRCPKMEDSQDFVVTEGYKLFTDKSIHYAIAYYIEAINLTPENVDILENLADCYSKLGYHYRALDEANLILEYEPPHCFQGVYYTAKALLGLQRYQDAIRFVSTQMSINEELKKSRDLNILLTKLVKLEYQQRTGDYDFLRLYKNDWLNEDYADYIGPVEIADIPGKNRGLIATVDIHAGQLLLVNKAFAIVYQEVLENSKLFGYLDLVESVAIKLEVEPEHADWFYKSYAGPEMSYLTNSVGNNSVDYQRIRGVCSYTSTTGSLFHTIDSKIKRRGLWILPSYINHNGLDANSFWEMYGDIMVVRAIKNISRGEEISVSYVDLADTFEDRDHNCQLHGFECSCSLCQADRNDSIEIREKRNRILAQFNNNLVPSKMIQSYVEQLEKLRPNPKLNVYIISPLKLLAKYYFFKKQYKKAADAMMKAHKIAKHSPMAKAAVECSMGVLNCYIAMGNHDKILQWIEIVKQDLIIAYGSVEIYKVLGFFAYILRSLIKMGINF